VPAVRSSPYPSAGSDRQPLPLTHGGVLDALRFAAAFCMVVYHFSFSSPVPLAKIHPLFERGYLATDFFLIVSGYVLGRIYGERVAGADIGAGAFFARRAQRLVPAHLIMNGAFVAMVLATALVGIVPQHPEYLQWRDLPAELFLVQAFGVPGGGGWNSPTWTLSALLGCYLLFPPIWRAQARIKSPAAVAAITVGLVVLADIASRRFAGLPIYEFTSKVGIVRAVPLFLLGAALARVSTASWIAPRLAVVATAASAVGLIALQFAGKFDIASIALICIMVTGSGAIPARRPSKLLKTAALVSFAIFITNEFVRFVYVGVLHAVTRGRTLAPAAAWASWWAALAIAIVFAVIFHYVVDMPTQRWIKRLRAGGRTSSPIAAVPAEAAA
jgi:peptidoglycan/LPS O-acetylase OafA/YrhL